MTHPRGLDGRTRDEDGEIRHKRGDTLIGNIEKEYGINLGARSDMRLDNYLDKNGYPSLTQAIKDNR